MPYVLVMFVCGLQEHLHGWTDSFHNFKLKFFAKTFWGGGGGAVK